MFSFLSVLCAILLIGAVFSDSTDCSIKVFDEGSDVPMEGFCVQEFKDPVCTPYADSFSWANLPADFAMTEQDEPISRPESISLTSKMSEYYSQSTNEHFLIPGVVIEWTSPANISSREKIKGYMMLVKRPGVSACRMFKFNTTDTHLLGRKLRMQLDVPYLVPNRLYSMTVYSMPPPDNWQLSRSNVSFVKAEVTSGSTIRDYNNPGRWTPSLCVDVLTNGTLQVKIGRSPERFNLTQFEVQLVKYRHDRFNAFRTVNFTMPSDSQDHEGILLFNNLEPDMYKVVVHVQDPFDGLADQCLCWVTEVTGRHCSFTCGSVQTRYIHVRGDE